MKRFLVIAVVVMAALTLALVACEKKTDTATTEPAKVDQPAAGAAGTPATDDATKKVEDIGKALAAAGAGANAADAPEYLKKSVDFIKEINKMTKENMGDCDKAVEVITKYMETHKGELEALQKQAEEAQAKMTDEDKMKMGQQAMALMGPIMGETMQVQMEFKQKCSAQADKLTEAMKAMQPNKKSN